MDIKEVKELLTQFDASSLTEFTLHEGSFELYMNKNKTNRPVVAEAAAPQGQPAVLPTEVSAPAAAEPAPVAEAKVEGRVITSPIVGVVYLQPAPEKPVFKEVGDTVKKGETVCIVEAMKLLNEITSEFDGTVTEILVKNEDIVEYGQPLFRIS